MEQPYLDAVDERVVVFDGAFGTYIQALDLGPDDFGGLALEGCNEMLCLTRPDVIAGMHEAFFAVGVDVVETASFGAFATVLAEYDVGRPGPRAQRRRRPHRPGGRRRLRRRRPHPLRRRLDRAGHQAAEPRPHRLRRAARRLPRAGARPARGRRRPVHRRDVHGPAAGEGGDDRLPAGDARPRPRRARCRSRSRSRPPAGCSSAARSAPPSSRWRRCAPTCSASTAPPGRPRCRSTCAT